MTFRKNNDTLSSESSRKEHPSALFSSQVNRLNASPIVLTTGKVNTVEIFQADITKMLLKASTVFIGLTLPNCIMRLSLSVSDDWFFVFFWLQVQKFNSRKTFQFSFNSFLEYRSSQTSESNFLFTIIAVTTSGEF